MSEAPRTTREPRSKRTKTSADAGTSERPEDDGSVFVRAGSRFTQQELRAFRPVLTPIKVQCMAHGVTVRKAAGPAGGYGVFLSGAHSDSTRCRLSFCLIRCRSRNVMGRL